MLFKQAQQVVDGIKRQTRRPVKPGEYRVYQGPDGVFYYFPDEPSYIPSVIKEYPASLTGPDCRLKWQVGKTYAAQPGRGKKSIGRTPPLKAIRRERLQEMSVPDCRAEMGCADDDPRRWAMYLLRKFIALWDSLYPKIYHWEKNPEVWVLEFEPI